MRFWMAPKKDRFFELFSQSASNIHTAAETCLDMVQNFTEVEEKAGRLKQLESRGDFITHEIVAHLNESFFTPFGREDILALAGNLDEVLDEIEGFASRLCLFGIDRPTPECVQIMKIVLRSAELVEMAMKNLRHPSELKQSLLEISSLENQVDQITRCVTARLFHDQSIPACDLIKWKEIYARLEHTVDRMEDVANLIADIVAKNS